MNEELFLTGECNGFLIGFKLSGEMKPDSQREGTITLSCPLCGVWHEFEFIGKMDYEAGWGDDDEN